MKTRKVVKTLMPVIATGVVTGVGSQILEGTMPAGIAKTATQGVLGAAGPIIGLGALANLTKEFDKGFTMKRRKR
jgi:hypothetical protein